MSYTPEQRKAYDLRNRDRLKAWRHEYFQKNRVRLNANRVAAWKAKTKDEKLAYRTARKDQIRNHKLKYKYGITVEYEKEMMRAQGGKCKICNKSGVRLVVDHCHKSGSVRSLLCDKCNHLLGNCEENIETLKNAIEYIQNNKESKI